MRSFVFFILMVSMQFVNAQTNIQVTGLTVSDALPNELQNITYTITIRNDGPQATTALQFLDLLPSSMQYVSNTPSQGTYDPITGLWNVGALASGQNRTLAIVAYPKAGTSGTTITNTASYYSSTPADNNASDNTLSVNLTVNRPDILVTKAVNDATPSEGQTILYTIIASNEGSQNASATGLVITDLLPSGLTYVPGSSTIPVGTTYNSGTGAWTIGTLIDNTSKTLILAATVNAGQSGNVLANTASVTAIDQPEEGIAASTASVNIIVNRPDIIVTKTISDATPDVSQQITYTITAKNIGLEDASATGLVITDLLPSGLTYVPGSPTSIPPGTTYNAGTGAWTIGTLLDNVTVTLVLAATVNTGQTGVTMVNTAYVSAINQPESNAANSTASVSLTVNFPDIQITKTISAGPYNENSNLTYTITVKNNGPVTATNVVVKDDLAATLSFVSASATQGTYSSTTDLWTVGTLATNVSRVLTIVAQPITGTSGTAINNTALLYSMDQNDPLTTNNQASVEIEVAKVDLSLVKSSNDVSPDVGQLLTFSVLLTNTGPGTGSNIVVKDILPAGLTFVAFTQIPSGTATNTTGTITWNVPSMAPGNQTLKFTATVNTGYGAKTIVNTAYVEDFQQVDPNLANNTSSVSLLVNGADLQITKTVNNPAPSEGSPITYTVVVKNNGPGTGNDVKISDVLPAGITVTGTITATEGTYAAGVWGAANNLDLNSGETQTLTINATVNSGTNGQIINNTASITSQTNQDGITDNNTSSVFFVVGNADVSLTKTVNSTVINIGGAVTYTLTLTNNGPYQAAGFYVNDMLPSGITYTGTSATLGSYSNATGKWTFGTSTLAVGATATLTITATVNTGTAGYTITNTGTLVTAQGGNNLSNDVGTATFKVNGADIAVSKTTTATTPVEGDPVVYTITATNNGPDGTTGLVIKDVLPSNLTFVSATCYPGNV